MQRRSRLPFPVLLAAAAALSSCASGGGQCVMREVADMPVLSRRAQPVVRVGVNGAPAAFVVDSGAAVSAVTEDAVRRFGLSEDTTRFGTLNGVGGAIFVHPATIDRLDLGTAAAREVTMVVTGNFGRGTVDGLPLAGLFAADFLANYDVEFDLPANHVSLYTERDCQADFAQPWDGVAYRVPFDSERGGAIMLAATLDGAATTLQLDSGAAGTVIDENTAARAGVTAAMRAADRRIVTHGIDGNALPGSVHRFGTLAIGPDTIRNPVIAVAAIQSNNLLGANFLRTHRVWVSYPHEILWVQPAGPVRLLEPAAPSAPVPPHRTS